MSESGNPKSVSRAGCGATLIVIGILSLVLPILGLQFKITLLAQYGAGLTLPCASALLIGIGIIVLVIEERRKSAARPTLTKSDVARIQPFTNEIFDRISSGEEFSEVVTNVATRSGLTSAQVALHTYEVAKALENYQQQRIRNDNLKSGITCSKCGMSNPKDRPYCINCGQDLEPPVDTR